MLTSGMTHPVLSIRVPQENQVCQECPELTAHPYVALLSFLALFFVFTYSFNLSQFELNSRYSVSFVKRKMLTLLPASSGSPRKGGTSWNQRKPRGSQSEDNNPIIAKSFPDKRNRVLLVFVGVIDLTLCFLCWGFLF